MNFEELATIMKAKISDLDDNAMCQIISSAVWVVQNEEMLNTMIDFSQDTRDEIQKMCQSFKNEKDWLGMMLSIYGFIKTSQTVNEQKL